ncbi:putative serine threonine- kinase pats1 [Brachionus plicatilis]|uniref:Putative serine threonine-kinase pats1 n=1 Tax=Brachionus plicatilis TaxID=10195 RepID=A0A3M7S7Z7_BRAPC|nr:putative serine threonine- kinase pats1 [Brachionus plicatilis]
MSYSPVVDIVSKYSLDQEDLKSRYKNIVGFFFVSSYTKVGIQDLKQKLITTTLQEKYIGEKIPEAWLNFEKSVREKSKKEPIINKDKAKQLAEKNGIYDEQEFGQVVKFLNDLGSLQYFENQSLRNKIVINPQWIVDAFAKIVSIKETCIQDGKFTHDKIVEIWKEYDKNLHEWMLKLTEEFDLTFPISEKNMSIVPCLLPDAEPKFDWPEIDPKYPVKIKQFKVNYRFDYLPIGLFNRIQVRLFQYGDNSIIWKKGSLLKKNSHLALLNQTKNSLSIEVKVLGVKPENIVLVIHEAIETLINDSFNGLKYDFSFPCPDCVESQSSDPHLFSSTLLKRASEMKAPFLQCAKGFHVVSIEELMAIMPVDDSNNLDLNLEYSIRDLRNLKDNFKYDIMFWFCGQDTDLDPDKSISPLNVIKAIESQGYKIWFSKTPSHEKLDKITSVIKQSKLVIFGVSDNFASDSRSVQIFELSKNLIKKTYLLIEFGLLGARSWLQNPLFASACADFRVIMQDPKRYATKIADTFESIEKIVQVDPQKKEEKHPDVFVSYCWANSHEAIKKGSKGTKKSLGALDPRILVKFFADNGINAWLDVDNLDSTTQMFGEITKGMNLAKVIVACVSDEYVESQNCKLEFRFAHISLKLPIIKAVVGLGNEWRKNEIAFLGSNYPEVNFQYELKESLSTLLKHVKIELSKINEKKIDKKFEKSISIDESNNYAYQELYELTQRKFLRQLIQFSEKNPTIRSYPRLFFLDLVDQKRFEKFKYKRNANEKNEKNENEEEENEERRSSSELEFSEPKNFVICIRPMCEHEECWHFSNFLVLYPKILTPNCTYLLRMMTILRNGSYSNEFGILFTEQGKKLFDEIKEKVSGDSTEISDSYSSLRNYFIDKYEEEDFYFVEQNSNENFFSLNKCELKNGKILWLCPEHAEKSGGKIISDQKSSLQNQFEQEKSKLILELDQVEIDIF